MSFAGSFVFFLHCEHTAILSPGAGRAALNISIVGRRNVSIVERYKGAVTVLVVVF
jgi:hypothetical protein